MITLVEKIVDSGIDGRVLILPLTGLIYIVIGQAKDFIRVVKQIVREGKERLLIEIEVDKFH